MKTDRRFAFPGFALGVILACLPLVLVGYASAQPRKEGCLVSEFKSISLGANDPVRKVELLKVWLAKNGRNCSETQARIIMSNSASWLGTALSVEISGIIEALYESKIANDETHMGELYLSKGKTFAPGVEVVKSGEPREPVVRQGPGATVVGGVVGVINDGGREPSVTKPPPPARFTPEVVSVIRDFFDKLRGTRDCPPFMAPEGRFCKSTRGQTKPYKLDQPLEPSPFITEIPEALKAQLPPPPHDHRYYQANEDIILVDMTRNVVVHAVVDYGGVPAKMQTDPVKNQESPAGKDKPAGKK